MPAFVSEISADRRRRRTVMAMDQDRRDAIAWAKEWQIRQKNRRLLFGLTGIAAVIVVCLLIRYIVIQSERSTYSSVEAMRAALQGRYVASYGYEEAMIEGDIVTVTFLEPSHYNREYAERYGYSEEFSDHSYEHRVTEWDYRHGVIKLDWGGDLIVDKSGGLRYSQNIQYFKTDEPRPEPIDPASLKNNGGEVDPDDDSTLTPEDEETLEELEEIQERQEEESERAEEAGVSDAAEPAE